MVRKVGLSNFLANVTTAIGFGVFYFTHSTLLVEFGVVAAINVIASYIIALTFLTIILSFLPVPSLKKNEHLAGKKINAVIEKINFLVHNRRTAIYIIVAVITLIGGLGMFTIKKIGYIVDDLPKNDPIYSDLRFFEHNFKGVLPFEILIDTKKEKGVFANDAKVLYKMKKLQNAVLKEDTVFSNPISVVEALRFAYQAYNNGKPKYYQLPAPLELNKMKEYISTVSGNESKFKSFMDSTLRYTRVTCAPASSAALIGQRPGRRWRSARCSGSGAPLCSLARRLALRRAAAAAAASRRRRVTTAIFSVDTLARRPAPPARPRRPAGSRRRRC